MRCMTCRHNYAVIHYALHAECIFDCKAWFKQFPHKTENVKTGTDLQESLRRPNPNITVVYTQTILSFQSRVLTLSTMQ